jgi:D-ribose pyranase
VKRSSILNKGLSEAIASMGHGDLMIVCDAGFPIPNDVWRVDLAIKADLPDLETVLSLVAQELIAEQVTYAAELAEYNAPLHAKLRRIFATADHATVPHAEIMSTLKHQAKVIVRTGAFDPWGNVLLYSGVDAPLWFAKPGVQVPDYYRDRVERGR